MKIRPVGAEWFHADGQTDLMKLIVAFRNFSNAPKKVKLALKACNVSGSTVPRYWMDVSA
jgi:hypothetical protein